MQQDSSPLSSVTGIGSGVLNERRWDDIAVSPLVFCFVGLIPLLSWAGTWATHFTLKAAAVYPLGGLLLLALAMRGRRRRLGLDTVDAAVLAFAAAVLLSTALSPAPLASLTGPYNQGTGAAIFVLSALLFIAGRALDPRETERMCWILLGVSCVVAGLMWAQAADWGPVTARLGVSQAGRPGATMGNPNVAGALLAAGVAAAWGLAHSSQRLGAYIATAMVVLTTSGLVLSLSRGAWLAALAGILVLTALRERGRRLDWRRALMTGGAIALTAVAVGAVGFGQEREVTGFTAAERVVSSDPSSGDSLAYRLGLYEIALKGFADRPLLGWGLGAYSLAWQTAVTQDMLEIHPDMWAEDPHSLPLDVLVGTGLSGTLPLALAAALAVAMVWRRRPNTSGLAAGVAAALGAALLVNPQHVLLTPLLFLAAGAACHRAQVRAARAKAPRNLLGGTVLGTTAVLMIVLGTLHGWALLTGDATYQQGMVRSDGHVVAEAADRMRVYALPYFDAGHLLTLTQVPADAELAVLTYRRGVAIQPSNAFGLQSLAAALLRAQAPGEALREADAAIEYFPLAGQAHLVRGAALAELDRDSEAERALVRSIEIGRPPSRRFLQAATILYSIGKEAEAVDTLSRGLALYPDDAQLRQAEREAR